MGRSTTGLFRVGVPHAAVIAALHEQCLGKVWSAESVGRLLALPGAFAVLAVQGETPVGFALCLSADDGPDGDVELIAVGVLDAHRRIGLGGALLTECLGCAAEQGARGLLLEVSEDNREARALYGKIGFSEVGRRTGYYGSGRDALLLRRAIAAGKKVKSP